MKHSNQCANIGCTNKRASNGKRQRAVCSRCHKAGYGRGTYAVTVTPPKKEKCSNIDGHLGFECPVDWTKIKPEHNKGIIHTDHKDGNPNNNQIDNQDRLCAICHAIKTYQNGDNRKNNKRATQKPILGPLFEEI